VTRTDVDVLVIGAGVVGLSAAVCLAESGRSVLVRTRDHPTRTSSCAAGALWGPVMAAHARSIRWSQRTLSELTVLAGRPDTGVRLVSGLEASRSPTEPHTWLSGVTDFHPCPSGDLPDGFVSGWRYTAPVVDMPLYLAFLVRRLRAAGGRVEIGEVTSLDDALARVPLVVNCTGCAARDMVPDPAVVPTRGQLVVADNPGVDWFFAEHAEAAAELTYFLPHGDHIVLGSTVEPDQPDPTPRPETAAAIVARCARVEPALAGARVRAHRVGFRPVRPQVRLERVDVGGRTLIHDYGHGGAGVSLSWGCAVDLLTMVEERTPAHF
jgi:D-amino-acid oxidase